MAYYYFNENQSLPCNFYQTCPNLYAVSCNPQASQQTCPSVSYTTGPATETSLQTGQSGNSYMGTVLNGFGITTETSTGGITYNTTTGQITIPIVGRYEITVFVTFGPSGDVGTNPSRRELFIYKIPSGSANSTTYVLLTSESFPSVSTSSQTRATLTTFADLNANDKIFVSALQTSGSTINVLAQTSNRLSVIRDCYQNLVLPM